MVFSRRQGSGSDSAAVMPFECGAVELSQIGMTVVSPWFWDLSGKKLHAKRNHINQFMAQYGKSFEYVKITPDMMDECVAVYNEWLSEKSPDDTDSMELCAIKVLLKHMDTLGIRGGGIRIDGRLLAFTLGQKIDDNMAVVHIEKADNEIMGLYTVINNQFVKNDLKDVRYINREEDMGLEFLGVKIDKELNKGLRGVEKVISTADSKVTVCIIPTDEELMIATDTMELL